MKSLDSFLNTLVILTVAVAFYLEQKSQREKQYLALKDAVMGCYLFSTKDDKFEKCIDAVFSVVENYEVESK